MATIVQTPVFQDARATVASLTTQYGATVTPGNTLYLAVGSPQPNKTFTVADDVNGSWGATLLTNNTPNESILFFAFKGTASGRPNVTATISPSSANIGMALFEANGSSGVIDQSANTHAGLNTSSSVGPTIGLLSGNEIVLSVSALGASSAGWSAGGGYNLVTSGTSFFGVSYVVPINSAGQTGLFSWTTSQTYTASLVTFANTGVSKPVSSNFVAILP